MAGKDNQTNILITAKDTASAVFDTLLKKVVGVAAAITAAFGVKDFFGSALEGASQFEEALSRVRAISGASASDFNILKAAAEQAALGSQFTAVEAAKALEAFAKAGLSATQSAAALGPALDLAQIGNIETAQSADFLTKAIGGMGLAFTDAGRVADVLAKAATSTRSSVADLADGLSQVAPIAKASGLSLEQTVAILGKFAKAGVDGERAGSVLARVLGQFADPASKFRNALADAGITTVNFGDAINQLAALGPKGEKAITALGLRAGPTFRALLDQGIGALGDLTQELEKAGGSAASTGKIMDDNLSGATENFGNVWEQVKRTLVEPLLGPLKDQIVEFADKLKGLIADGTISKFGEAIRDNFLAAAAYIKDFVSKVDFTELANNLKSFVTTAVEGLKNFEVTTKQVATVVNGAFLGISTFLTALTTGFYTLVAGIAKASQAIADFVVYLDSLPALGKFLLGPINLVLPKIEEARSASQFFGEVADQAFKKASDGAQSLNDKYNELIDAQGKQIDSADQAAAAIDKVGKAYDGSSGSVGNFGKQVDEVKQKLDDSAKQAAIAAAQVEAAFQRLGITTQAELKVAAENAKRDFQTIRDSGTAAPEDISAAFEAYATKAIAANKGVVDALLAADGEQYNVSVTTDQAGKAVVQSMDEAAKAVEALANKTNNASDAFNKLGDSSKTAAADVKANAAAGSNSDGVGPSVAGADPLLLAGAAGIKIDPAKADEFRRTFQNLFDLNRGGITGGSTDRFFQQLHDAENNALRDAAAAVNKPLPTGVAQRYEVNVVINGQARLINTASQQDAANLVSSLQELQSRAN